ncbi:MAG: sulfide:quinone oxidoreductase [Thermoleophilaceae bacterium]|jgi:sulfide:quinone oxidoreductase|nr:sulfide:quinone oxidoreductase [Thermoleophilaceae bacterium]
MSSSPQRVVIAGAGVAGLEALLALHALAGDLVEVTLLAPEAKFTNRPMSVNQPFKPKRVRGLDLATVAAELGARWHRGTLDRVDHARHLAVSGAGEELAYDQLVLALGARPDVRWDGMSYCNGHNGEAMRLVLQQLLEGRISKVAYLKPPGPSWPLPLYDLALKTAAHCAAHGVERVDLTMVTPEEEPLAIFGHNASDAVRRLLEASGVTIHSSSYGVLNDAGQLEISPGGRSLDVHRVVTEPRLSGPIVSGVPFDSDRFIPTDAHGRVPGLDGVFAAGDATAFPVKHGGLAAEQADAVAETIAAAAGADVDPQPFHPVLRGLLLTGGAPRYLRADISGTAGDDSTISTYPLWSPPNKIAARYLAPYLSRQTGDAADVHVPAGQPVPVASPS